MKNFFYRVATDQIDSWPIKILKIVLWVLSCIYGCGVAIVKLLYRMEILKQQRLPKPVISIGNITLGGVGKTPLIEYVALALRAQGFRSVILTRGYMAKNTPVSDEAEMLRKSLRSIPVLAGKDRFKNAQEFLVNNSTDIFLLDDGFQHWRLFRDMDIAVIDATDPWGNRHLIPRGILREPLNALKRADIFVLTKTDLARSSVVVIRDQFKSIVGSKLVVEAIHEPTVLIDLKTHQTSDVSSVSGQRVCLVCSIGNPKSFEDTLIGLGASIQEHFAFLDHYVYTEEDIKEILRYCKGHQIKMIVTTQKDAAKLGEFLSLIEEGISLVSLQINIVLVKEKEAFLERINHLLHR